MKSVDDLLLGKDLSISRSEELFRFLLNKKIENDPLKKQILVLLQKKGEHANELVGLVRTIRKMENRIPHVRIPYLVDGCGTGGDGACTFSISTIASIVAAGAGAHVAKHGNRSISSRCGSADLLEALRVKIDASPKQMLKALKKCGMGYFHAPLYHPLFKGFQSVRSSLAERGVRTIFNLVGPLVNPLKPRRQVIGVFRKGFVDMFARTVKKLNYERVLIVWGYGGLDELTTTDRTLMIELNRGKLKKMVISPHKLGMPRGKRHELKGGNSEYNRKVALSILEGEDTSTRHNVVLLNAAAILYASGRAKDLREGILLARKSIESKAAKHVLEQLIEISHGIE